MFYDEKRSFRWGHVFSAPSNVTLTLFCFFFPLFLFFLISPFRSAFLSSFLHLLFFPFSSIHGSFFFSLSFSWLSRSNPRIPMNLYFLNPKVNANFHSLPLHSGALLCAKREPRKADPFDLQFGDEGAAAFARTFSCLCICCLNPFFFSLCMFLFFVF